MISSLSPNSNANVKIKNQETEPSKLIILNNSNVNLPNNCAVNINNNIVVYNQYPDNARHSPEPKSPRKGILKKTRTNGCFEGKLNLNSISDPSSDGSMLNSIKTKNTMKVKINLNGKVSVFEKNITVPVRGERVDRRGVAIVKNGKKHKVSFMDSIMGKEYFIERVDIESFKKYNISNTFAEGKKKEENQVSCCLII